MGRLAFIMVCSAAGSIWGYSMGGNLGAGLGGGMFAAMAALAVGADGGPWVLP